MLRRPARPSAFGKTTVTVYTANQGADTWHVLYAWHHDGSLYTISQHVAPPFTYRQVVQSLEPDAARTRARSAVQLREACSADP